MSTPPPIGYQPPPPPPPPPPPEEPPPPEPLLEPGAVEAEAAAVARLAPMAAAKRPGLDQGLWLPEYQVIRLRSSGLVEAAARISEKREAHLFSTPRAMA